MGSGVLPIEVSNQPGNQFESRLKSSTIRKRFNSSARSSKLVPSDLIAELSRIHALIDNGGRGYAIP